MLDEFDVLRPAVSIGRGVSKDSSPRIQETLVLRLGGRPVTTLAGRYGWSDACLWRSSGRGQRVCLAILIMGGMQICSFFSSFPG
jgi:hypothetical protein